MSSLSLFRNTRPNRFGLRRMVGIVLTACTLTTTGVVASGAAPVSANGCAATASAIEAVPANYGGGAGTTASPFQITTAADLLKLASTSAQADWDKHFEQTQPIVLTGCAWTPIGRYPNDHNGVAPFTGSFNGGGNLITGLTANLPTENYVGMFGFAVNATLSAVNVAGSVTGFNRYVGGLVGSIAGGLIENSVVDVDVSFSNSNRGNNPVSAGGLAGDLSARDLTGAIVSGTIIRNSTAHGDVTAPYVAGVQDVDDVGGLVGSASRGSQIVGSHATGAVISDGYDIGGLIGYAPDAISVTGSSATGSVDGYGYVGGLIGYIGDEGSLVAGSHASGPVSGGDEVGGLIGRNSGSVTGSYATGSVSSEYGLVGGLIGYNYGSVTDSYATGSVTDVGSNESVGGLIGYHDPDNGAGDITNSYATGNVSAPDSSYVGGLIGYFDDDEANVDGSRATGRVIGYSEVGGLIGYHYGDPGSEVVDSYATGAVEGFGDYVGGLIGESYVPITRSYATGDVSASTSSYVGGLVGYHEFYEGDEDITGSYATGEVSGSESVGGLIGECEFDGDEGIIGSSYARGDVTASASYAGGLIGYSYCSLRDSYAEGNVIGVDYVGGLLGWHQNYYGVEFLADLYATGNVLGSDAYVGGLIGYLDTSRHNTTVSAASASGSVTGASQVGGLIGVAEGSSRKTLLVDLASASGAVTGVGLDTGGLIGGSYGIDLMIRDSRAIGNIVGVTASAGLVGGVYNGSTAGSVHVNRSFAAGSVTGSDVDAGGLIGVVDVSRPSTVSASFTSGDVEGAARVGGLIGRFSAQGQTLSFTLQDVYTTGDVVVVQGSNAGGLIGIAAANTTISATNGYVSGVVESFDDTYGAFVGGGQAGAGYTWTAVNVFHLEEMIVDGLGSSSKTEEELKTFATFDALDNPDWSISNGDDDPSKVWGICDGESFPFLMWQTDLAAGLSGAASCGGGEVVSPPVLVGPSIPGPERIAGSSRIETAVSLSREFFSPGVPVVYLATAATFADALVAGPAAGFDRGPVLLTLREAVPASTLAELRRLKPTRIVVVGGELAISAAVFSSLSGEASSVVRIGGDNRYETAALLSQDSFPDPVPVVYVATGEDYADAVAGGPASGLDGAPILLVRRDVIPAETIAELQRLDPDRIVVLGLTNAVSSGVEAALAPYAPRVVRIGGATRHDTSAALSASKYAPGVQVVFLATGSGFADALSAVPPATIKGGPVLLTLPLCVPKSVMAELKRLSPRRLIILGGEDAVSDAVKNLTVCSD